MRTIKVKLFLIACLVLCNFAEAKELSQSGLETWIDNFISKKKITDPHKLELLRQAKLSNRAVELDRKQPEGRLSFSRYLDIIGYSKKIADGKKFYNENRTLVDNIANKYGVDPQVLVAIVGMESHFGKIQGRFKLIDTLSTLAYEGRRAKFFTKELENVLEIASEQSIAYEDMTGSWAGAMGWCQFMPSSYISYAVDYDGDGKKDIWNNKADALASAAKYLSSSGWKRDKKYNYVSRYNQKNSTHSNLSNCNKSNELCECQGDMCLISVRYDGKMLKPYVSGKNIKVLMKWNRSYYFGLAVMFIANKIVNV